MILLVKMKFLCFALLMVGTVCAAPTLLASPAVSQYQYLLLSPQYHNPIIKLSPQAIQPISSLTKLHTPGQQFVYVYPGASSLAPIAPLRLGEKPIPLTILKQDGGYLAAIYNYFNNFGAPESPAPEAPAEEQPTEAVAQPEIKFQKFEIKKDEEKFPLTPASTIQLEGKHYYIISGQPQFYGNFDAFNNHLHPLISLQPLQPIIARSNEAKEGIQAEADEVPALRSANPLPVQTFAPLAPVPALIPEQLRVEFDQPQAEPQLVAEPLSNQLGEAGIHPRSLTPEASSMNLVAESVAPKKVMEEIVEIIEEKQIIDAVRKEEEEILIEAEIIDKEISGRSADALSLAQAKPSAIAIAGDGGIATSGGLATAIAGKDGYAISAPQATSIAGDIFSDEEKAKTE